jgi:hypothetical protein
MMAEDKGMENTLVIAPTLRMEEVAEQIVRVHADVVQKMQTRPRKLIDALTT